MMGAKDAPFPAQLPSESSLRLSLTCLAVVSPTANVNSSRHLSFKLSAVLIALTTARTHRGLENISPTTWGQNIQRYTLCYFNTNINIKQLFNKTYKGINSLYVWMDM